MKAVCRQLGVPDGAWSTTRCGCTAASNTGRRRHRGVMPVAIKKGKANEESETGGEGARPRARPSAEPCSAAPRPSRSPGEGIHSGT